MYSKTEWAIYLFLITSLRRSRISVAQSGATPPKSRRDDTKISSYPILNQLFYSLYRLKLNQREMRLNLLLNEHHPNTRRI